MHPHVGDKNAADTGAGGGVRVTVIERAVLPAALARAGGERPTRIGPVPGEQRGASFRHPRLPLADAGRELVVARDDRARPGRTAALFQPVNPASLACAASSRPVVRTALTFWMLVTWVCQYSASVVRSWNRVARSRRLPKSRLAVSLPVHDFSSFGVGSLLTTVFCADRALVKLGDRRHAHRAAHRAFERPEIGRRRPQRGLRRGRQAPLSPPHGLVRLRPIGAASNASSCAARKEESIIGRVLNAATGSGGLQHQRTCGSGEPGRPVLEMRDPGRAGVVGERAGL